MINNERLRRTFLDLLHLNSPPGEEREVAKYCAEALRDAGFICQTDRSGNVIAQKSGEQAEAPRIFLSAHTDTVQPTFGLVVRELDGVFRTSGNTILGADDKAALSQLLEAMRVLDEQDIAHGDLQVILSTREEVGLLGAQELSPSVIAGSLGFVFDASGATGAIITTAPAAVTMTATFKGKAAHAGFVPENGVSALRIAARAIERMPLGRIDPETTANVGTLHGGTADNIVAEDAVATFEARSRNAVSLEAQVSAMRASLDEAARHFGGTVTLQVNRDYEGYVHPPGRSVLLIAAEAWRRTPASAGAEPTFRPTGGASDANIFNSWGIPTVVLSCGYRDAHSVNEHIPFADLIAGAEWAVEVAKVAGERRG